MHSYNDYLKQFWLSKHFQVLNDSISPRQKAEELRRLLFPIQAQKASGEISIKAHSQLNEKLSSAYSSVVDSMENGLNNYDKLLFHSEEPGNGSHWQSALELSSDGQPLCLRNLLANAGKTLKRESAVMKMHFSRSKKAALETTANEAKSLLQFETEQQYSATASRFIPSFGKRKTSADLDPIVDKIPKSTILKQREYLQSRNIDNTHDSDLHCEDKKTQSTFLTAREQLVINKRKMGRYENCNAVSTSSYGNIKKSLGTRRGLNSKFKPPVCNQDKEDIIPYNNTTKTTLDSKYQNCEWMRNVDPKMVELIENEIMENSPGVSWDDIAGLEFAKTTIQEIVIWPMLRPDIFTGLRGPPKGILLFGPPGTGKTLIGKCIASRSNATFFSISASSLTSKWVGEGEKMVRALFGVARCHQPAVIFIDEIDSLLTQRSDSEHESSRRIKTEFLIQLDGATCSADDRLLVVGATNRPQELDEAARRRLVKRLYIPLPECMARKQIIQNLMSKQLNDLTDEDLDLIMSKTIGFSGADMASLCREAALGPIRNINDIRNVNAEDVRAISSRDFEMALKSVRPSVSEDDMQFM